jgi:hypothetical protein
LELQTYTVADSLEKKTLNFMSSPFDLLITVEANILSDLVKFRVGFGNEEKVFMIHKGK